MPSDPGARDATVRGGASTTTTTAARPAAGLGSPRNIRTERSWETVRRARPSSHDGGMMATATSGLTLASAWARLFPGERHAGDELSRRARIEHGYQPLASYRAMTGEIDRELPRVHAMADQLRAREDADQQLDAAEAFVEELTRRRSPAAPTLQPKAVAVFRHERRRTPQAATAADHHPCQDRPRGPAG